MKTVMQELIELRNKSFDVMKFVKFFDENQKEIIAKEKIQIECNWIDGKETKGYGNTVFEDAEIYYNKKYVERDS